MFHPHEVQLPGRMLKYLLTVGFSVYALQSFVIYVLGELWRWPVSMAQCVARSISFSSNCSQDFIDRMTGKVAAVFAGIVWNCVWFRFFVYA